MWLFATTFAFKTLKKFGEATTQKELQAMYHIKPNQLALCIPGWRYWGSADQKAIANKCKSTNEDTKPSTSKK